ncbi:50S ribosomal protein L37e [Methanosarcinales archaeon]|nr:MAG: 50S ribosomal protein L37e [Methanosarcinales archaeon]HHI30306.1 50S ribosomal protein L37e [Candidatus Methanoperedenaceae archaeon]
MSKGTPSQGKRQKRTHIKCRRCGRVSYHTNKKICSYCGFGRTKRMRNYRWKRKAWY